MGGWTTTECSKTNATITESFNSNFNTMQSAQESLAELRAAIRYCENAISAAESTIESMDFRQQLAKQQAMNKQESTGREVALTEMVKKLEAANDALVIDNDNLNRENAKLREASTDKPTMPVIPRDVAIAIFREGVQSGVRDAVAELEGNTIKIRENDYVGDFEVSFSRDIDLDDELDLDWMRDKVGQYNEEFVADALKGLCEKENFECRIHGIDDNK